MTEVITKKLGRPTCTRWFAVGSAEGALSPRYIPLARFSETLDLELSFGAIVFRRGQESAG